MKSWDTGIIFEEIFFSSAGVSGGVQSVWVLEDSDEKIPRKLRPLESLEEPKEEQDEDRQLGSNFGPAKEERREWEDMLVLFR